MIKIDISSTRGKNGKTIPYNISKEARRLIASGVPDQPVECYRGDMLCLTFKSLKWIAERVMVEEPSLHYKKFMPFVDFRKTA